MRTTGVRCVPRPAPRPTPAPKPPTVPPKPLPRTKFLQEVVTKDSSSQGTLQIISQNLPSPIPADPPSDTSVTPTRTPPPKPPRADYRKNSPSSVTPPHSRRPGLMHVLTRPTPTLSTASSASASTVRSITTDMPTPSVPRSVAGAIPTRRAPIPRLPLSLPPPPAVNPPRIPQGSSGPPRLPTRPTATQLASRARAHASSSRPASRPVGLKLRTVSVEDNPVCTVEDFEDSCQDVYRNVRSAKKHATCGRHVQAASHYQAALTAIDRVLRAQVLSIIQHEVTRQKLFLQQQEVFTLRKDVLNGFTDSQTAIRTPRGLDSSTVTPGAPPSYDDVLQEDRRRLQEEPQPRQPSERRAAPASASAPASRPAKPVTQSSAPPLRPAPPQPPTTSTSSPSRLRSLSGGDSRVEELVDVRASPGQPLTAPPITHAQHPLVPSRIPSTRPKTSYHPTTQPDPPASMPPASLPPTALIPAPSLLPTSLPASSLPPSSLSAPSFPTQPSQSLKPDGTRSTPSPVPLLDEVVLSQMKALHVYEGGNPAGVGTVTPARNGLNTPLLPMKVKSKEVEEQKARENNSVTPSGNTVPPSGSMVQPQGSTIQASAGSVHSKNCAKEDTSLLAISLKSPVEDPFVNVDPFPPVDPRSGDNDALFLEETLHTLTPAPTHPPQCNHSPAFSDDFNPQQPSDAVQNSLDPGEQIHLGDSILEALDFAVTVTPGHRKVTPQRSRTKARSYSEENLLDSSHNTLEAILKPGRDLYASRASIIEEFDPLMTLRATEENERKEEEEEGKEEEEGRGEKEKEVKIDERGVATVLPPKPAPRTSLQKSKDSKASAIEKRKEGEMYNFPPEYSTHGAAAALKTSEEEGTGDFHGREEQSGAVYLYNGARGRTSCSSSEDSGMYSWPPDYSVKTPSTPITPLYPCMRLEEEEEEEEEEVVGAASVADVGRSAFYVPHSKQTEGGMRDILKIREGVKIYFIHNDGVITSPWNRPFLAISKDLTKGRHLLSDGLVLSVGASLWACELQKKATLVLRTQSGHYMFEEVAGKPDCKAVAIRVPSSVRRAQQELLSSILQHNTLLEEERPKGISKAISKSASTAATKMNKIVEDQSMSPSQPFVRRNSMRALKGVSRRLNNIAERTGINLKELPDEYRTLQEAADALTFSRNAKMIQFI